jgi:hypothetical protein
MEPIRRRELNAYVPGLRALQKAVYGIIGAIVLRRSRNESYDNIGRIYT